MFPAARVRSRFISTARGTPGKISSHGAFMGVRESLNENKKLGVGVGAGIFVVALAILSFQLFGGGGTGVEAPTSAFYTDDDGKTFFKDDAYKVVPFNHGGKQAYRAEVFQCSD